MFLNVFSCPQPPREVGTWLGPPARLGQGEVLSDELLAAGILRVCQLATYVERLT